LLGGSERSLAGSCPDVVVGGGADGAAVGAVEEPAVTTTRPGTATGCGRPTMQTSRGIGPRGDDVVSPPRHTTVAGPQCAHHERGNPPLGYRPSSSVLRPGRRQRPGNTHPAGAPTDADRASAAATRPDTADRDGTDRLCPLRAHKRPIQAHPGLWITTNLQVR
jgi:hypothetical protein